MVEKFSVAQNKSTVIGQEMDCSITCYKTICAIFLSFLIFTSCATLPSEKTLVNTAVEQAFNDVDTKTPIAVVHIQSPSHEISDFLLDEIQHVLVNKRYTVVEREKLDVARTERDFQYTSEVDDNTAVALGKIVGAGVVVTGGVSGSGSLRRLGLKVIDVQTAILKGTASVPLSSSQFNVAKTSELPIDTPPTPRVTTVSVTPGSVSIIKGQSQQFNATVNGSNNPSQNVNWTVSGATSSATNITSYGRLSVSSSETARTLTVRATSSIDTNKSGIATITVTTPPPTVTSVTISPSSVYVQKGNSQQFNAVVNGTNNPSQDVTWTVLGGNNSSTSISSGGRLSVSSNETARTLTVIATSAVDRTVKGNTTVTLTNIPPKVSSVSVNPSRATVTKGQSQYFNATVIGSNNPPQEVVWVVTGGNSYNTTISSYGRLNVSSNETATSLTVTATSTSDRSVSGSVTVAITNPAPTVSSLTVSPSRVTITKGQSQQFNATVNGSNNPSQEVSWTVTGGNSYGTSINSNGRLSVSSNETASSLTVKATSIADRSKSSSATVTLTNPPSTTAWGGDVSAKPPKTAKTYEGLYFTVQAGGSVNWFSNYGDVDGSFKKYYGFDIGSSFVYEPWDFHLVFDSGVKYINRGAVYEEKYFEKSATLEESFNFVDIFSKLKWEIPITANKEISPFVGYAIGYLFRANERFEYEDHKEDSDITKHCNSALHLLVLGADFDISNSWFLGMEYDHCLTSIYKDKNSQQTLNTFILNIGRKF